MTHDWDYVRGNRMNLSTLIASHGYWILALGCFLEGETILLLAGVAAHLGYMNLWAVLGIAVVCGFAGDQFFFWLGRSYGARILARWPSIAKKVQRVELLIERHDAWVIVGIRFAYGLRIAGPIVIGMSAIPLRRLLAFNFLGALLWAPAIAGLGWMFGQAAERLLDELHQIELWLLLGLVALAAMAWWLQKRRRR